MALATYTDLLNSVADWLKRDELTSAIPDFVVLAESEIYRRLRVREMEAALSSTIASGTIPVPADYTDLKFAYLNTSPVCVLEKKAPAWVYEEYPTRSSDGRPGFIARDAATFIFGPFPDSDYAVKGVYYKRLPRLSVTLNTLYTDNPGLYLFGALLQAEAYTRNDPAVEALMVVWRDKFDEEIRSVQGQYDREMAMPGNTAMRTRGSMP